MLTACVDNVTDACVFVVVEDLGNEIAYVAQMESDTLTLCHEIKSAKWFKTEEDARNARKAISKNWVFGVYFRVAKYYMSKEVLCLL